jgi:hypothetical protein
MGVQVRKIMQFHIYFDMGRDSSLLKYLIDNSII